MTCDECGAELQVGQWPFCHGDPTKHAAFQPDHLAVIDDSWPGGKTFENMGPTPVTCYSRSEWVREMKARGLINKVEHVGVPGTDKSPNTSRWV